VSVHVVAPGLESHAGSTSVRRVRVSALAGQTVLYAALITLSLIFALPLFWLISTSLKANRQIFAFPPIWIPSPVIWQNYPDVFLYAPFAHYLFNTLLICSAHVIGPVITCSLAAYAFARLRAPGSAVIFMLMLSTLMVPGFVTLVPVYILFAKIHWIDTFKPLIIPALLGNPFFIFLLRQFLLTIPADLEEAARIDGATHFTIWYRIMLPLTRPALATVAIFGFQGAWNDLFGPLIFLNSSSRYTLALGLQVFQQQHTSDWGLLMAASTMMVVPMLVIFFFAQRQFIQGIVLTGIKG